MTGIVAFMKGLKDTKGHLVQPALHVNRKTINNIKNCIDLFLMLHRSKCPHCNYNVIVPKKIINKYHKLIYENHLKLIVNH